MLSIGEDDPAASSKQAMWVQPRPTVGKSTLWVVLKENAFFQLLQHKSATSYFWAGVLATVQKVNHSKSSYQPSTYRIVMQDEDHSAVAVAEERTDIDSYWDWIEKKLLPDLSKDDSDRPQMLQFLRDKFAAKAEDVEQMQQIDDAQFHRQFDFPEETLFVWYFASLWQGIYRPGYMYLTDNLLCFSSKLSKKLVIPLKEISEIKRENSMAFLDAIVICTRDGVEFYFGGLVDVDVTLHTIEQLWNLAMDKVLRSVSKRIGAGASASAPTTKQLLLQRRQSQAYNSIFKLPHEEALEDHFTCSLFSNDEYFKGSCFVSCNFVCFQYLGALHIEIVLPMMEITGISKDNPYKSALSFVTSQSYRFVFSLVGVDHVGERMENIHKLWSAQVRRRPNPPPPSILERKCSVRLGDRLLLNPHEFGPTYAEGEARAMRAWDDYFSRYGRGLPMIKTAEYRLLLRGGVPNHLRAEVWQLSCGSCYRQLVQPNYYRELLASVQGRTTQVTEEIERDLHRSFPEHPFFQSDEGVDALRNVLVAYAFRNPAVNYCQSMNIVCAMLLLFMPEENVFWMMCAIVEQLVPEYYNEELFGSLVDQHIFEVLIEKYLPRIKRHLDSLGIPLAVITLPWLLCFYIGYVPMEAALRTLDSFFCDGPDVLFATGLAIFNLCEPALLHTVDNDQIVPMMRRANYTVDDVVPLAASYEGTIKDEIRTLRLRAKYQLVTRMEGSVRQEYLAKATRVTPDFSKAELERLYDAFQRQLSVSKEVKTGGFFLDTAGFARLLQKFVPWWKDSDGMYELVWKHYSSEQGLSFEQYVRVLASIRKGDLEERVRFCFELLERPTQENIALVVKAVAALYGHRVLDMMGFVQLVYEKAHLAADAEMPFEQFKEVALDSDLMETSFNLLPREIRGSPDLIAPPEPPPPRIDLDLDLDIDELVAIDAE